MVLSVCKMLGHGNNQLGTEPLDLDLLVDTTSHGQGRHRANVCIERLMWN